jgi:16S rRNA (adenine1518-N6/adenine1519-N6)-dimethyltransferase
MVHRAKKALGQNFLINTHYISKILDSCRLQPADTVLEIGPGQGALTFELAKRVKQVIAVEVDRDLVQNLMRQPEGEKVDFIHQSILDYSFRALPPGTVVVSNLPYNIATPIIEKILTARPLFKAFYMTVQLEYGQRIVAAPGSKKYGSLSCFVQYHAATQLLFKIPPTAFRPVPKVCSCFLALDIKQQQESFVDEAFLFRLIQTAFQQRRKKLPNALSPITPKETIEDILSQLAIPLNSRAENLSLEQFINIVQEIKQRENG